MRDRALTLCAWCAIRAAILVPIAHFIAHLLQLPHGH